MLQMQLTTFIAMRPKELKDVSPGKNLSQVLSLTNAQIINYFVENGMPANDMKALKSSVLNLFQCGHVHDIRVCFEKHLAIQVNCAPEIEICLLLEIASLDIIGAKCGCPAGKGPCASCKHVAALYYALKEFSQNSCESWNLSWNQSWSLSIHVRNIYSAAPRLE